MTADDTRPLSAEDNTPEAATIRAYDAVQRLDLAARHAALVAAAQAVIDAKPYWGDLPAALEALEAALASEEAEPCGHSRVINSRCDYCGTLVALAEVSR